MIARAISGSPLLTVFCFFNILTIFLTSLVEVFSDFSLVQTIFPDLKTRVAVLGLSRGNTSPGKNLRSILSSGERLMDSVYVDSVVQ